MEATASSAAVDEAKLWKDVPEPPSQFTFELKEIKEEDEEVFEDSEDEEEQQKPKDELEVPSTEEKEKEKGGEDEGKGKEKERVLEDIPVKPVKTKEELAKEKEERIRLKKEKKRLEREKEKELPPLVKLNDEEVNQVFERLPEERRLPLNDDSKQEEPFLPREKSAQPPSVNNARTEMPFPPPLTAPKTEKEMEKERKQQQKEEAARRKREAAEAKREKDLAFMSDEKRKKELAKDAAKKKKEDDKEAEKQAKEDQKRIEEEDKRSKELEIKLAEAKAAAALLAEKEAEMRRTLLVTRYTPEGNLASNRVDKILITFNHPVVDEKEDISALGWLPTIEPEPLNRGEWQVAPDDKKTLVYYADNKLDMALANSTEYTVTVLAGSQGTAGEKPTLKEKLEFKFRTPRIKVVSTYPTNMLESAGNVIALNPFVMILFDQFIDMEEVAKTISVYVDKEPKDPKSQVYSPLTVLSDMHATREELEKAKSYDELSYFDHVVGSSVNEGKWIALRINQLLPHDKDVYLKLGPELPSAEGPLKTLNEYILKTRTVPPIFTTDFQVVANWGQPKKPNIMITFSQSLFPTCTSSKLHNLNSLEYLPTITPRPAQGWDRNCWALSNYNQTLTFTPDTDYQMSTKYTVKIPKQLPFLWGAQLLADGKKDSPTRRRKFNFTTQTNKLVSSYPADGSSGIMMNTPILCLFEQKIDTVRDQLLGLVSVSASKWFSSKVGDVVPMTKEELEHYAENFDAVKNYCLNADESKLLAFRCAKTLPVSTRVIVTIGPKVPSSEGEELNSDDKFTFNFDTVGNFAVTSTTLVDKSIVYNLRTPITWYFNHPLLKPYSSIDDLAWRPSIEPEVDGQWAVDPWSFSLTFTPSADYSKSTAYTCKIEKGTASFFEDALSETHVLRFTTPVISVTQAFPQYTVPQARDATCWVCFDQIIDPDTVVQYITVSQSRWKSTHSALTILSAKDAAADKNLKDKLKPEIEGFWVAFKCNKLFDFESNVTVTVKDKMPSAEGPLLMKDSYSFSFTTIPPFTVTSCSPQNEVYYQPLNDRSLKVCVSFSHPLIPENGSIEDMDWTPKIKPKPPKGSWQVTADRYTVYYENDSAEAWPLATAYTVKTLSGLKSFYGDPLEKKHSFKFHTPTLRLTGYYPPSGSINRCVDTPFILVFNQKIKKDDVLPHLTVTVGGEGLLSKMLGGKKSFSALQILSKKELRKERDNCGWSSEVRNFLASSLVKSSWIAVKSVKLFPHDENVSISVSGCRGVEGHLEAKDVGAFSFRTIPPFKVNNGYKAHTLDPQYSPLYFTFNHPICGPNYNLEDWKWRPKITPKPTRRIRRWFWKTEAANVNMHPSKGFFTAGWNSKEATKPGDEQAVQANLPLSRTPDSNNYFEVHIKTIQGNIGVGAAPRKFPLTGQFPGWKTHTYGYHNDDGKFYHASGDEGVSGQPTWGEGDVIGCGINPKTREIYWTKNGDLVGTMKLDKKEKKLYPTVAFDNKCIVWLNLGKDGVPFLFAGLGSEKKKESDTVEGAKVEASGEKEKEKEDGEKEKEKDEEEDSDSDSEVSADHDKQEALPLELSEEDLQLLEDGGTWYLFDEYTAQFFPAVPWNRSTEFVVTVEEGVQSYLGYPLEKEFEFKFSTPTIQLVAAPTDRWQVIDPFLYLCFDQLIDEEEVLKHVQLSVSSWGFKQYAPLRLLKQKEYNEFLATGKVQTFPAPYRMRGYYVVFKSTQPLPPNTNVYVKLSEVPSLEGPLKGSEVKFSFDTLAPFDVVSGSPTGNEVSLWAFLRINFNQPIVDPFDPDIRHLTWKPEMEPEPLDGGGWVINDARCLTYVPSQKWDSSTKYTVKVPQGIQSYYGEPLAKSYSFNFSTRTIRVIKTFPSATGRYQLDTPIFICLNQFIDQEAVLKVIKASASWIFNTSYAPLRLMSPEEVKEAPFAEYAKRSDREGYWIALRSTKLLPANSTVTVTVGPEIPSAEGPLKAKSSFTFSFKTVPAFKITKFHPSSESMKIYPNASWLIRFSNQLANFKPSAIKIDPPLDDVNITYYNKTITIQSYSHVGDTVYTITFDRKAIMDIHGQQLGAVGGEMEDEAEAAKDVIEEWKVKVWAPPVPRALTAPQQGIILYDPVLMTSLRKTPTYHTVCYNYKELRVCLYKMKPRRDLPKWGTEKQHTSVSAKKSDTHDYLGYGKKVFDQIVPVENYVKDTYVDFLVDLTPALRDAKRGVGQVAVVVMPTTNGHYPNEWSNRPIVKAWIQCTHIGLDAFQSLQSIHVWSTNLLTGTPMDGVKMTWHEHKKAVLGAALTVLPKKGQEKKIAKLKKENPDADAKPLELEANKFKLEKNFAGPYETNQDGLAVLSHNTADPALLVATKGKDCCFIQGVNTYTSVPEKNTLLWHVFDDRSMYRPKEEVHLKGYVRLLKCGSSEHFEKLHQVGMQKLEYRAVDPRGLEFAKGEVIVSAFGSFDLVVALPDTVNLGDISLHLTLELFAGQPFAHKFQVQEFRRPEFVAEASVESKGPAWFESPGPIIKANASYYAGGGLPDSDVTWKVSSKEGNFTPPGWIDFSFDISTTPLRTSWKTGVDCQRTMTGKTRQSGDHKLRIELKDHAVPDPPRPVAIAALAEIIDINRQTLSASTQLILHPCEYYVGLLKQDVDVTAKEWRAHPTLPISIVVVDHDGSLVGDVSVYLLIRAENSYDSSDTKVMMTSSSKAPVTYEIDYSVTPKPRKYRVRTIVSDSKGRINASEIFFEPPAILDVEPSATSLHNLHDYYTPAPVQRQQQQLEYVKEEAIKIIAKKKSYKIGETAELVVQCPFAPCDGLITARCRGIVKTHHFHIENPTDSVFLPIVEEYAPNITIQIDTVGLAVRANLDSETDKEAPPRPGLASGLITLTIPPITKELQVETAPRHKKIMPGGETTVDVKVTNHKGEAVVWAEVCVVVVDESVIALTGHKLTNPLDSFYPVRSADKSNLRFANRKQIAVQKWDNKQLEPPTIHLEDLKANWSGDSASSGDELPAPEDWTMDDNSVVNEDERFREAEMQMEKEKEESLRREKEERDRLYTEAASLPYDVALEPIHKPQLPARVVRPTSGGRSSGLRIGGDRKGEKEEEEEERSIYNDDHLDSISGMVHEINAQCESINDSISFDNKCYDQLESAVECKKSKASSFFGGGGGSGARNRTAAAPSAQARMPQLSMAPSSASYSMGPPPPPPAADGIAYAPPPPGAAPRPLSPSSSRMQRSSSRKEECKQSNSLSLDLMDAELSPKKNSMKDFKADKKKLSRRGFAPTKSKKKHEALHSRKKKMRDEKEKESEKCKKDVEDESSCEDDNDDDDEAMEEEEEEDYAAGGEEGASEEGVSAEPDPIIAVRSNFNPLANFTAAVVVDADGTAHIPISIPDNLTRYRIWAVATSNDGYSYGLGESVVTAQLPLVIRSSPPRFLNYGDSCEFTVVLQNQLEQDLEVNIGIRTSEHTLIVAEGGEKVREIGFIGLIKGSGRRMLSIPIVTTKPGRAAFQISCSSGKFGDAADIVIPIYPPMTKESFAVYGSIGGDNEVVVQTIAKPADALPDFGGVELSISSTMMQALLDAMVYLYEYTADSCEAAASKLIALVAMQDTLDAFQSPKLPKKRDLKNLVSKELGLLKKKQRSDGGFGMWSSTSNSYPWVACHVAHCAGYCKAKGYGLPWFFEGRITSYLKDVLPTNLRYVDADSRDMILIYALYARYKLSPDSKIKDEAAKFYSERSPEELPMEGLSLLLFVLADADNKKLKRHESAAELARYLISHIKVDEEKDTARVCSFYDEVARHDLLHSDNRVDAMLLEALVVAEPTCEMIPKLVKHLLAIRKNGVWLNTQENCWVTVALDRYFNVFEKATPDFRVRMWLCDKYCGETLFEGRQSDTRTLAVAMPVFSKALLLANTVRIAGDLSIGKLDFHKSSALTKGGDGSKGSTSSSSTSLAVPGAGWEKTSPRKDQSPRKEEGKESKSSIWSRKSPRKEKKEKKEKKKDKKEKKKDKKTPRTDDKSPRLGSNKSPREPTQEEATPKAGTTIVGEKKEQQPQEQKAGTQIVVAGGGGTTEEKGTLLVQKEGKGRLYYRLGMSYAPASLEIPAKDYGFVVSRTYAATDKEHSDTVTFKDGVWNVKKGAKVTVTIKMAVKVPRFNIAVIDKLPGGFEPENPALKEATQDESKPAQEKAKEPTAVWWEHQNLRDERAECFAAKLQPGEYVYTYSTRATTPGRFIVPPCHAEEMYNPELYGNSSSNVVLIS